MMEESLKRVAAKRTEGEYFYRKNFNPWQKCIGDCAVRAISAALMMKYVDVCRALGIRFRNGEGMVRRNGVAFMLDVPASPLAQYFEPVRIINASGMEIDPDDMPELERMPKSGIRVNVNDFCSVVSKRDPGGVYVLLCVRNEGSYGPAAGAGRSPEEGHVVAAFAQKDHPYFVDTWDSGDMIVYAYAKVRKQVPKNSPERLSMREFEMNARELELARVRWERELAGASPRAKAFGRPVEE